MQGGAGALGWVTTKELNRGQEWGQAPQMSKDRKPGQRPWALTAQARLPPGKDLANQQMAGFIVEAEHGAAAGAQAYVHHAILEIGAWCQQIA